MLQDFSTKGLFAEVRLASKIGASHTCQAFAFHKGRLLVLKDCYKSRTSLTATLQVIVSNVALTQEGLLLVHKD